MVAMTFPVWLQLLIYALAVARVTGLIVADSLTEDIRDGILDRLDDRPRTLGAYLGTLITCPWCAGMWVALFASPLVWFWGDSPVMLIPALALAFSQVTGMTASVGR
jgi:ABC-type transport system involved in cytochrome c biogenesis permease component